MTDRLTIDASTKGPSTMNRIFLGMVAFAGLLVVITLFSTYYTVSEGNVAVVTRLGKAVDVVGPGLHFKTPFIQGVEEIETRERVLRFEPLLASTSNELPVSVTFSVNWALNKEVVLDTFKQFGGIAQFEDRVLKGVVAQAAKDGLARFSASELVQKRGEAAQAAFATILAATERLPITLNAPNLENIDLPDTYEAAIQKKEEARQLTLAEQENLKRQQLETQRSVQTAQAEAESTKARAEADAYRVQQEAEANSYRVKQEADAAVYSQLKAAEGNLAVAKAEAEGKRLLADAITANPALVQYEQATRWDGQLPRWMMGGGETRVPMMLNMAVTE